MFWIEWAQTFKMGRDRTASKRSEATEVYMQLVGTSDVVD